jgi:hypothetical protein
MKILKPNKHQLFHCYKNKLASVKAQFKIIQDKEMNT